MKIPVKWLKEYVEFTAKPAELSEILTMSGTAVEGVTQKNGTDILHLEITTNRPDCLSLYGIASEISAMTGKKIKRHDPADVKFSEKKRRRLFYEQQ